MLKNRPPFLKFLVAGIMVGGLAAVLNNIYGIIYSSSSGTEIPKMINFKTISLLSVIPIILASLLFYLLARFGKKGKIIFFSVAILVTGLSFFLPGKQFAGDLNALTVPMHFIAGLTVIFALPYILGKR